MTKFGKIVLAVLILGGLFIVPATADEYTPAPTAAPVPVAAPAPTAAPVPTAAPAPAVNPEFTRDALQRMYMDRITIEGYRPEVDADGDIQFRVLGSNYFIIIDESDLQFFQIYTGFWLDDISLEEAYEKVNYANRRSKVAKISLSTSDDEPGRVIVSITAELLVENPRDFEKVLPRALSLLANARNIFQLQLAKL